jgi:hypothetical protein
VTVDYRSSSVLQGEYLCKSGAPVGFELRAKDISPLQVGASTRLMGDYSTVPRRRRYLKGAAQVMGAAKEPPALGYSKSPSMTRLELQVANVRRPDGVPRLKLYCAIEGLGR